MAVVVTESWTGTNGAAWPSQWTTKSGTATIQSNTGQIVAPTGGFSAGRIDLTGMPAIANIDAFVRVTGTAAGVEQYAWLGIMTDPANDAGYGVSTNEIYFSMSFNATSTASTVALWQGPTQISGTVTKTLVGTTTYAVRVRCYAGQVMCRVWEAAGAEPSTWDVSVALSSAPTPNATGVVSLSAQNGGNGTQRTFQYDNLSVDDLGTTVAWLRI